MNILDTLSRAGGMLPTMLLVILFCIYLARSPFSKGLSKKVRILALVSWFFIVITGEIIYSFVFFPPEQEGMGIMGAPLAMGVFAVFFSYWTYRSRRKTTIN
jgi:hypothetical protein